MSIIVKNISTSNDNQLIHIDGWIMYHGEVFEGEPPLITIDCCPECQSKGDWYFGNKEGGKVITDEEFKNFVIQGIEDYTKSKNSICFKIKNSIEKENLN